ncbi:MAG: hypothetical protein HGA87_03545 [Desulfobulbaceae bacterium]|nr:hypothetical protein [Desulfobulbaceae bacterium]
MDILTVVLSSSVVSAIVSALVGGLFSLRTKQNEYANAYYKMILERRLAAYEEVERLIVAIKVAVIDDDKKPYHFLFSKDDDQLGVYQQLHGTMSYSLWLSDELFELTRQLNFLVYSGTPKDDGLVEFAKKNYTAVAELRTKLETVHTRDMLALHDVPSFLKAKKPKDGYVSVPSLG